MIVKRILGFEFQLNNGCYEIYKKGVLINVPELSTRPECIITKYFSKVVDFDIYAKLRYKGENYLMVDMRALVFYKTGCYV